MAAEAELLEQKQIIECEAQKLKIREELAKASATIPAYDEMKPINSEAITQKEKQLDQDGRYHRPDHNNTIPWKEKNCINTWDSSHGCTNCTNLEMETKYLTKSDVQLKPNILKTKNDKKVL